MFRLPNKLKEIEYKAFANVEFNSPFTLENIKNIALTIHKNAFEYSEMPIGFKLPNSGGLTIEEKAFYKTKFKDGFTIPTNTKKIEILDSFDQNPVGGSWIDPKTNSILEYPSPGAVFKADI